MLDFDIAQTIREISILAVPLLMALTGHEVAHGYVAYRLGDPTAKAMGRLTLNPIKHLDPLGTLIFFIAKIGWAKPVPVNPRYFKDAQKGMLWVAVAGPAANFIMAAGFAAFYHLLGLLPRGSADVVVTPLIMVCIAGVLVNLILGFFNLIPIPPLDGANIVAGVLPRNLAIKYMSLGRYGMFIIIGLVVIGSYAGFSPLGEIIFPLVELGSDLLQMPRFF